MAKLKLGIDLHNRASVFMPQQGIDYDLNRLIDLAVLCEELGFYSVSVGDSLLSKPRWRAIPTMAAMAAKTSRIKITSHILMPHLYNNPVLLAQELATLDVISKGRVVLGCGIGAGKSDLVELEHQLCGVPKKRRGKAFDECLMLLKRLWTEDEVTHHGEFWQYEGVSLGLKPHQKPHPPIWVGGETKPARRRAGQVGEGWYPVGNNPSSPYDNVERFTAGIADMRSYAEEVNRDPLGIYIALNGLWFRMDETFENEDGDRMPFTGSDGAIIDDIGAYRDAGLNELIIGFESDSLQVSLDRLDAFADRIMPNI